MWYVGHFGYVGILDMWVCRLHVARVTNSVLKVYIPSKLVTFVIRRSLKEL